MKAASVEIECVHSHSSRLWNGSVIGGLSSKASFNFDAEGFLESNETRELVLMEFYKLALAVAKGS